ncbi:hypothetical protein CBS101457_005212 [Exobasidium rhododendri]|nr:hypothetical protein CBS101457_005212 [Exobasidium rhododendri]
MHTAISATPLLSGRKENVDCILVHAGNLLLGGPHSSLVAYKLPDSNTVYDSDQVSLKSTKKKPLWSVRLSKSPKSVEQIKVIREANIFVTLSDGVVALHDVVGVQEAGKAGSSSSAQINLSSIAVAPPELTTTLIQSKGAITFAIDTSIQRLNTKDSSFKHGLGAGYRHKAGPSTIGRAYRPSDVSLGRKMGASMALRGGQRPISASLRGMEDLQRDKEEKQRWMTMNARMASTEEGDEGVMSIVSTLTIACRRKLIVFRWVDGSFWDTKEIPLPHTPRTLAYPTPTSLFMGYTSSEYAILTIPLAASSSVSDLLQEGPLPAATNVPTSSIAGTRVDLYEWPLKSLTIPLTGRFNEADGGDGNSNQSGNNQTNSGMNAAALASGGMAAMAGAAFGGLGGYIGMGNRNKPLVLQIDGGEVLVCRDSMGVFLSEDGKPTRRDGIEWPAIPEEVSFIKPYVFSILPAAASTSKQAPLFPLLQVRSASTLVAVQTLPFPPLIDVQTASKGAPMPPTTRLSQMAGQAPTVRLLTPSTGGKPPLFVVVTPTERGAMERDGCSIWCLEMKSWGKQIDELVEKEEFQEALALLNSIDDVLLEDKEERRSYIEALYAVSLFASSKFDEAIEHFIELETNPARVIALYPEEISGPLAKDRSKWVEMFGGAKKEAKTAISKKDDSDTSSILSTRSRKGTVTMDGVPIPRDRTRLASLWGRRPQSLYGGESSSPSVSVDSSSPTKGAAVTSSSSAVAAKGVMSEAEGLEAGEPSVKEGEGGAVKVIPAATTERSATPAPTAKKFTSEEEKRSIDALGRFLADRRRIFKPILEAQSTSQTAKQSQIPRDSDWLLNLPSQPLPSMEIDQLTAVAQTVDTALFKTFLATKPALVGPLCRVENWCEVEQVEELLMKAGKYSELIALYGGKEMHGKALKLLRKFGDEEEDIEEKVRPTIRYLQNLGPEHLPLILETAHWVLGIDKKLGMEIFCADAGKVASLPRFEVVIDLELFDEELCIEYINFLIQVLGEADPSLHEKLAFLLLRKAEKQQGKDKEETIASFLLLLESSHQYRAERVLNRLPTDDRDWFEARALLLGRLGQHEAALAIYVNKLKENAKAEEYCRRVQKKDDSSSVFLILLRIYLKPKTVEGRGEDAQVELEAAIGLISRHGSRIDSVAALELLPPLVSLHTVEQFASKALRKAEAKRNEMVLLHHVAKERALQVNENLVKLHSRRVKVTDTRTCPRCMKRLGSSVIAVNAKGAVMHYGCAHFEN